MKKSRSLIDSSLRSKNPRKWCFFILSILGAVYLLFIAAISQTADISFDGDDGGGVDFPFLRSNADPKPVKDPLLLPKGVSYGRLTSEVLRRRNRPRGWSGDLTILEKRAESAWRSGSVAWREIEGFELRDEIVSEKEVVAKNESCPSSVSLNPEEKTIRMAMRGEEVVDLPCGLEVGSSITVIAMPEKAHREYVSGVMMRKAGKDGWVMTSQFMVELLGAKVADGEDPPKILHFNPRLKGDWSGGPVIEVNTCYRMQWGKSMRCDGMATGGDGDGEDKGLIFALMCSLFI